MITAQYHGTCSECEDDVLPGERIENGDGEWRHVDCGERPVAALCVCEKCWLVHAGECL